jgi:hypothetical protein
MARSTGKVIEFPRRLNGKPEQTHSIVRQDRLLQIMNLQLEEARVVRLLREQMLALQSDIATGASVEEGPLTFDPEIRVVKRTTAQVRNA